MIKFIPVILVFLSSYAVADAGSVRSQIQAEYGDCYNKFDDNLQSCTPSSCSYPDLTDAKSWKAMTISGMVDGSCYVMYYSFVGQNITSNPYHCFYTKNQRFDLAGLYSRLFNAGTTMDILSYKEKIEYLGMQNCKQNPEPSKQTETK